MKSLKEFSKKVTYLLIIVWFAGALFGGLCVLVQLIRGDYMIGLSEFLAYIGAPMTGGIVGYMLKSGFENKEKIRSVLNTRPDLTKIEINNNIDEV